MTRRKFTRDDLDKLDFSNYLASDDSSLSSDEDEDEEAEDASVELSEAARKAQRKAKLKAKRKALREKYKALLQEATVKVSGRTGWFGLQRAMQSETNPLRPHRLGLHFSRRSPSKRWR